MRKTVCLICAIFLLVLVGALPAMAHAEFEELEDSETGVLPSLPASATDLVEDDAISSSPNLLTTGSPSNVAEDTTYHDDAGVDSAAEEPSDDDAVSEAIVGNTPETQSPDVPANDNSFAYDLAPVNSIANVGEDQTYHSPPASDSNGSTANDHLHDNTDEPDTEEPADTALTFTDSDSISFRDAVRQLASAGIVVGYRDGSFRPQFELTRAQACVILCRMLHWDSPDEDTASVYGFSDTIGHWAEEYINICASKKVIDGYQIVREDYQLYPLFFYQRSSTYQMSQWDGVSSLLLSLKSSSDLSSVQQTGHSDIKAYIDETVSEILSTQTQGVGPAQVKSTSTKIDCFGPNYSLTGAAWAKMLLCAGGFDAASNHMIGSNWEKGVTDLVEETDMSRGSGAGFSLSDHITREQACLLAFNAMQDRDTES